MSNRIDYGTPDPRVRRYLMPARVVWSSGDLKNVEALLVDDDNTAVLTPPDGDQPTAFLLDFGREVHGGVRIDIVHMHPERPARARIRFGESVSEAMGQPVNDHSMHDFDHNLPWFGHIELGNTGFRFVRVDLLDPKNSIDIKTVKAVALYRDLPYLGSFQCSDQRLNEIWQTGAYTTHLCMQDHVWDGIKRDRLVWVGDIHPEAMVISTVFGEADVLPQSLDYVRDRSKLPCWMNGHSSYSLWWIQTHYDWYRYHGNLDYLKEQRDYLVALLAYIETCLEPDGRETLGGARFLEWPTSRDPSAIDLGMQALTAWTLRTGAQLCRIIGEPDAAERAQRNARLAASCQRPPSSSKQANALRVLAATADAQKINNEHLARDPYHGLSTFYGYYILQARAMAGDYAGCLDLIRTYWGGMLDAGATTFWEGFDIDWMINAGRIDELVPEGKVDIHADCGDYCYQGLRHSLCHGWASGPTAWLTEHVLGLAPVAPGFERMTVSPHLAGLDFARGTLPTPHGIVTVCHERRPDGEIETKIDAPKGIELDTSA